MTRKIGFAFPGQGSQSVGMLAEHFVTSKVFSNVFDISKEVLGTDFKKLIEEGTAEDLAATQVTQPLLLTSNYALWKSANIDPKSVDIMAGHSLGEYSAYVAAETIKFEENIETDSATARTYFEANRNIHRKFVELAENRYLLEMFDMIWGKANSFSIFATIENVDLRKSLGDHMALVDVISTGDKTETLEVFTQHIQEGFDLQLEGLHQSQ